MGEPCARALRRRPHSLAASLGEAGGIGLDEGDVNADPGVVGRLRHDRAEQRLGLAAGPLDVTNEVVVRRVELDDRRLVPARPVGRDSGVLTQSVRQGRIEPDDPSRDCRTSRLRRQTRWTTRDSNARPSSRASRNSAGSSWMR